MTVRQVPSGSSRVAASTPFAARARRSCVGSALVRRNWGWPGTMAANAARTAWRWFGGVEPRASSSVGHGTAGAATRSDRGGA